MACRQLPAQFPHSHSFPTAPGLALQITRYRQVQLWHPEAFVFDPEAAASVSKAIEHARFPSAAAAAAAGGCPDAWRSTAATVATAAVGIPAICGAAWWWVRQKRQAAQYSAVGRKPALEVAL
jgi:hypothetical protein